MNRSERRALQFGNFTTLRRNHQPDWTHGPGLGLGIGREMYIAAIEYCNATLELDNDHLWDNFPEGDSMQYIGDPRWS